MRALTQQRPGIPPLVICVWVVVLAGMSYLVAKPVREPSLDFYPYYAAASAIHEGKPLYARETLVSFVEASGIRFVDSYTYTPTLALLIQPFLFVSPYVASLLWFGLNVGLLVMGVGLLFKQSNLLEPRMRVALLLLPVLFTPVLMGLYLGNVNLLILVLIVLARDRFVGGRPYASGVLLGLSTWIKVWPVALIAYFAWKREWKVGSGAVIGLILIGAVTVALAGPGQTKSFFTDRLPELLLGTEPRHDHLNQSIAGVFAKTFAPSSEYVLPLVESQLLAQQGGRIAVLFVVVATAMACSWPIALKDREQFSGEFMLVVTASLLITGWLWEATLSLLLPAYFLIAEDLQHEHAVTWRQVALPIGSILLIDLHRVIWTLANPDRHALPWFLLIFPFLGLILIWWSFVARRIRQIRLLRGAYVRRP